MEKNYYEILGVDKSATQDQIKKAYRKLAKKYHPDKCKDENANIKFSEIHEAFSVLSDPEKKDNYDKFGTANPEKGFYREYSSEAEMHAAFMAEMQRMANMRATKGADLKITIKCTLEELYNGVHKKIKIKRNCKCHHCHGSGSEDNVFETCPKCGGRGRIYDESVYPRTSYICPDCMGTGKTITNKCPVCGGTGVEMREDFIEFDIPANIPDGAEMSIRGKGHAGVRNGIPGDLIVKVIEVPNENGIIRDDDDLRYKLMVDYTDLVFGCETKIPWINGLLKFKIEPGTESGHIFMMRGRGMPNVYNPAYRGNYFVTVECSIPDVSKLSKEEKDILNDLRKERNKINKENEKK